uniref:Uncharacterized protein n=1 Tax=viral metagenome TaxID=1070528 RepID=A0A6M3IGW4_9ZZZZ
MAEEEAGTTAGTGTEAGQTGKAPEGTTKPAPKSGEGKPGKVSEGKAAETAGPPKETEEAFFDPKDLDPSLMPAYKNMQRAFSKKMDVLSKDRQKVDAFNQFETDPVGTMQRMAQRMGYRLTRAEAAEAVATGKEPGQSQDWNPQSWQEVMDKFTGAAEERILQKLGPIVNQVQEMRKTNIEKLLDDSCPEWRTYEDEMKGNIQAHPSLVNDPVKLYRLSVPPEVLESRAVQSALKKLESKVRGSEVSGTSKTTKHQATGFGEVKSFDDAVKAAQRKLAEQGIRAPGQS